MQPICNVLYKIIAKLLANNLWTILLKTSSWSESAFMQHRSISDNMFLLHQLIKYYKTKGMSATAILKIYIQKAYDAVDCSFLWCILLFIGFPLSFVDFIMISAFFPTYVCTSSTYHYVPRTICSLNVCVLQSWQVSLMRITYRKCWILSVCTSLYNFYFFDIR